MTMFDVDRAFQLLDIIQGHPGYTVHCYRCGEPMTDILGSATGVLGSVGNSYGVRHDDVSIDDCPYAWAREQPRLFEVGGGILEQPRDGATFDPTRDLARLNDQHLRVYRVMRDGEWRTLGAIAMQTGDPEASISARLRDFRKPRFGGHTVERRHIGVGLWAYCLIWNEDIPRPEVDE